MNWVVVYFIQKYKTGTCVGDMRFNSKESAEAVLNFLKGCDVFCTMIFDEPKVIK